MQETHRTTHTASTHTASRTTSPLPFVTSSLPHHFPSSPLPFLTTSHGPHLPSSPLPFITASLPHHFPSSPLPIVPTSLPHHFPSSPLPFVTTSLRHHFPSSPLPFVTTSLRHHFPSSPPRHCQHPSSRSIPPLLILLFCIVMFCCYVIYHPWSTTLHQSQFHRFLLFCYVLLCYVLLYDLPPFIISSLRILFVRNTEVLLPNFLWSFVLMIGSWFKKTELDDFEKWYFWYHGFFQSSMKSCSCTPSLNWIWLSHWNTSEILVETGSIQLGWRFKIFQGHSAVAVD